MNKMNGNGMPAGMPAQGAALDFSAMAFLVVDDFHGMRGMLRDILRACGANAKAIDTAASGSEAIALLEKRKYNVVLCDYNLGAGKNGQQVLEEAKYRQLVGPACAWLMVTAEKTTDTVMAAAEYQPDSYLIKPITEAVLRTRLAKIWAKKEAFRDIDNAMAGKDYLKAIRLCEQRLAFDKANAGELQRVKCNLLVTAGELEKAKDAFQSVLAARDVPWAKLGLAKAHYQNGDYEAARELLQATVDDNRSYLEAYDWLAKTLQALGELERAEEVLDRAAKLSPNSVTRQKSLGEVALKLGKLDSAERAFRKSVNLGEFSVLKTPDAYLGLAKTCSAKSAPEEALRVLGKLGKEFDSEEVRIKAKATEGMVYHQSGDPIKARQAAQALGQMLEGARAKPDSATSLEMAQLMLVTGEKEKAVELLQAEVKSNPEDRGLLDRVRQVFEKADMGEEGAALVEVSRKESVEMMNRGVLLAREGRLDEALDWMRNARDKMPSNVRVLFNYAHVNIMSLQQNGRDPALARETRQCLLEANTLAPGEKRFAQLMALLDTLED